MPDPHDPHRPAGRADRKAPDTASAAPASAPFSAPSSSPPDRTTIHPATRMAAYPTTDVTTYATTARTVDQTIDSSSPATPAEAALARRRDYGAQNRRSVILVATVAVAAVGLGGYFLISSKSTSFSPAAYANQSGQAAAAPAASPARTPAAAARVPFAAAAPQSEDAFAPPAEYAPNSLTSDPGCVGYTDATDASSAALGAAPTTAAAAAALTALGASLEQASTESQDPTLAAALAAEASFVQRRQPALVTALASGDPDTEVAAYQPIEDTDDYVSAVCGSDLDTDGASD